MKLVNPALSVIRGLVYSLALFSVSFTAASLVVAYAVLETLKSESLIWRASAALWLLCMLASLLMFRRNLKPTQEHSSFLVFAVPPMSAALLFAYWANHTAHMQSSAIATSGVLVGIAAIVIWMVVITTLESLADSRQARTLYRWLMCQ